MPSASPLTLAKSGITIQVSFSGAEDIRLVRIVVPSPDLPLPFARRRANSDSHRRSCAPLSVDDLYQAERSLLNDDGVIPLFHLPFASAAGTRVRGWVPDQLGRWNLADVWLEGSR